MQRAQRRKDAANRRAERLYAELVAAPELRPTGAARATAIGFALLVHAATLVVLGLGVLLIFTLPHTVGGWVCGPALVYIAYRLRPRTPKLPEGTSVITRAEAPELYGVLDALAARTPR